MRKKMIVALMRVSTDSQDTLAQKTAINDYCNNNNIIIDKWIEEDGVSGFKTKLDDRKGLNEIKSLALSDELDTLIIFNTDRLGRRLEIVGFISLLTECGVKIISVTEGIINEGNDTDSLIQSIKAWTNEYESKKTAERVRNAKKALWKENVYSGGRVSFGYIVKDKRVMIDENKVDIVKKIFDLYINFGSAKVLEYLDSLGIKNLNGKPYSRQSVTHNFIKNRNYIGYRKSDKNGDIYCPQLQIIDDDTFEQANEILKNRTTKPGSTTRYTNNNSDNLYEGLIYHQCIDQLTKLHITYNYSYGNKYQMLKCHYCKEKRYNIKKSYSTNKLYSQLDQAILEKLNTLTSEKIEEELNKKNNNNIDELKSELNILSVELEHKKKILEGSNITLDKIFSGELQFDIQTMLDRISNTQNEINDLEIRIKKIIVQLEAEKNSENTKHKLLEKYKNLKEIYLIGSNEQKKRVLQEIIDKIIIDGNDNITIRLKHIYI